MNIDQLKFESVWNDFKDFASDEIAEHMYAQNDHYNYDECHRPESVDLIGPHKQLDVIRSHREKLDDEVIADCSYDKVIQYVKDKNFSVFIVILRLEYCHLNLPNEDEHYGDNKATKDQTFNQNLPPEYFYHF